MINIQDYIKRSHEVLIGEYRCEACCGTGVMSNGVEPNGNVCSVCHGTRVHYTISKRMTSLMQIFGELWDADEAFRENRRADWLLFQVSESIDAFEKHILNTPEDHFAMALIRLFDLCSVEEYDLEEIHPDRILSHTNGISNVVHMLIEEISSTKIGCYNDMNFIITLLYKFCEKSNIPIEKHIEHRLAYMEVVG